jgi:hypothetical protein
MIQERATTRKAISTRNILIGLTALLIVTAGGVAVWTTTCPCDRMPGLVLFGELEEKPVTDWSFANDVPLCALQVYVWGFIPHALNLNCMATPEGELFLSCSQCEPKRWSSAVVQNEPAPARMRLNGRLYPVVLNRVRDEAKLDYIWAARIKKLQVHGGVPYNPRPSPDAKRPAGWWSFQVRSAVD